MKKYICLRDDVTNYLTSYQELEDGYGIFWGQLPVTLATIPFVHGSELKIMDFDTCRDRFDKIREWQVNATEKELSEYHVQKPIGLNKELVEKLKLLIKEEKIEIAQHGVTHRYDDGGAEMKNGNYNYRIIRDGKEYLEKVFEVPVTVFIPPSNTIDVANAKALKSLGLKLLCCGSLFHYSSVEKFKCMVCHPEDWEEIISTRMNRNVKPLRRREGVWIANSVTFDVYKEDDEIFNKIYSLLDKYGFASMTTHYRLLGNKFTGDFSYRERYQNMLERLQSIPDIEFVTASRYFELMEEAKF